MAITVIQHLTIILLLARYDIFVSAFSSLLDTSEAIQCPCCFKSYTTTPQHKFWRVSSSTSCLVEEVCLCSA